MRFISRSTLALLPAVATIAACSDTTKAAAGRPVSVSFSTASSTASPYSASTAGASASLSPLAGASRSVTMADASNSLVITKAQLVIARMELEREGASCASTAVAGDDDVDEHECAELTLAPSVVDLPLDASVATALQITIPAGTYSSLEATIRPIRASDDHGTASAAFLAAHPELTGVSVRVEGTYNGTPFVWTGSPRAEFETEFNPPLVVDAAPVNVTIHVDVASWFRSSTGAVINPATAAAGGANAGVVSDNIRRSFHAFHDDDRDDHDDADEHHG